MPNPIQTSARGNQSKEITGQPLSHYMRYDESVRHMIVFEVLEWECPVGDKGETIRIFLNSEGYKKALQAQSRKEMVILTHARVNHGHLFYDDLSPE